MKFHQHTGIDSPNVLEKDLTGFPRVVWLSASDNLKISDDDEMTETGTSYVKEKEVQIFRSGYIRVKFDAKTNIGGGPFGAVDIRVNNVSNTATDISNTAYATTVSSINIKAGDYIQLYAKGATGGKELTHRNFRIYYDIEQSNQDYLIS